MSAVGGVDSAAILNELNKRDNEEKDDAGQADFLKLLVAQLENQNPLEPQESGEFLSQLAQFSTVEGIEKLNITMEDFASQTLSNQALQATALVGRSVLIPSDIGHYTPGEAFTGAVSLPASTTNLTLDIIDQKGSLVHQMSLGSHGAGAVNFSWNGLNANGEALPAGLYQVRAQAGIDGEVEDVNAFVNANVDSVTTGNGGNTLLNLAGGLGSVPVGDVLQIN